MNNLVFPQKVKLLFSALCFSLAFQSCNKEADTVNPQTSTSDVEVAVAPPPCETVCLVAGQTMNVGTVSTALVGNMLYVTYNITAPGVSLLETHVDVFDTQANFKAAKKMSGGGAIPGKFAYKNSFSGASNKRTYTEAFELPASLADDACFNIATHAALSNGETAWGGACPDALTGKAKTTLANALQFDGANWGVYYNFCKASCGGNKDINFTYAWEDLTDAVQTGTGFKNDADYNDLVIQSIVTRSANVMQIKFFASARGASADHAFKFKVPQAGVTSITGDPGVSVATSGSDYVVTVFPSTKDYFKPAPGFNFTNTEVGSPCVVSATRTVTINGVTSANPYNTTPASPYMPFITVSLPAPYSASIPPYDLYVLQLTKNIDDTYDYTTALNTTVKYPNGILIPSDWKWPLENVFIKEAYPQFNDVTNAATYTPNFAGGPVAGKVFTACSN
jgi:LruC domain-containing protein